MSKKKKQKYYAIKEGKGVKNKIVRTWSECKELLLGYPSIYRGSVRKMRISHVKSIFPADTNGLQTF